MNMKDATNTDHAPLFKAIQEDRKYSDEELIAILKTKEIPTQEYLNEMPMGELIFMLDRLGVEIHFVEKKETLHPITSNG